MILNKILLRADKKDQSVLKTTTEKLLHPNVPKSNMTIQKETTITLLYHRNLITWCNHRGMDNN